MLRIRGAAAVPEKDELAAAAQSGCGCNTLGGGLFRE